MRDELDNLLRDVTLTTLSFAVALGWSLYQLAHGVAVFIDNLTTHVPSDLHSYSVPGAGLTWVVGHRVVALDGLLIGLLALPAAVLGPVVARRPPRPTSPFAAS